MEVARSRTRQVVRAQNYGSYVFEVSEKKRDFRFQLYLKVEQVGMDIGVMLLDYGQFTIWANWFTSWKAWQAGPAMGPTHRAKPVLPRIPAVYSQRTNLVEKTFDFAPGTYALLLDNTYSQWTDKTVDFLATQTWDVLKPPGDLPIVNRSIINLPLEVQEPLAKANECYVSGHYAQSAVMFRKALDFAIRLKLFQSGLDESSLSDSEGNELSLSKKIKLLRDNDLITQTTSRHIHDIKWFGDLGAHSKMPIVFGDIRDIIEPKVRAFLTGLGLAP